MPSKGYNTRQRTVNYEIQKMSEEEQIEKAINDSMKTYQQNNCNNSLIIVFV